MIDLTELTDRILKIRRGELPQDAVTEAELREALAQRRESYAKGAETQANAKTAKNKAVSSAVANMNFEFKL